MKIVVFETELWARAAWNRMKRDYDVKLLEEFLTSDNAGEHSGVEVICTDLSRLDADTLEKLKNTKLIATQSTGVDKIDLEYCMANGISVCNVPAYAEIAVAEHVFALLLSISRHLSEAVERTRKGNFSLDGLMGFDLCGKILAIVGTGVIGRHVGKIAKGFGMEVVAFDVRKDEQWAAVNGIRYMSIKEALSMADIVTLHLPFTPETHHLISGDQFAMMKEGVVLINTARGELVDTQALIRALASGKVAAAGLDVLPEEQVFLKGIEEPATLFSRGDKQETLLANHALLRLSNVIVTPHCGFFTKEASQRIIDVTIANIKAFIHGKPQNIVVPVY
jgi:D-lactate dehydrogenase